jgi:hypothetical protein
MHSTDCASFARPHEHLLPNKRAFSLFYFRSARLAAIVTIVGVPLSAHAGMTTSLQISGSVGYELAGIASPGPPISASITLSNIPIGAIPLFAIVYTNDFSPGGGQIDAKITPLVGPAVPIGGGVYPSSSDPVPIAQTFSYRIPITPSLITGNGSYGIDIVPSSPGGNANQMAGAAMLVIYSSPLLPQSTITVDDGVFLMGTGGLPNAQSTTFQQMTDPIHANANSSLSLLTFADDSFTSGEKIKFNGSVIGGPIDGNLSGGGSASIFNFTVSSLTGSANTATLTSTGDIFGWHVAVLQTPVPEPSGFLLAAVGLLAVPYFARRFPNSRLHAVKPAANLVDV